MLDKFLKSIKVGSYEELTPEEKETYRNWEASLQGRSITEPDYRAFLESELNSAIVRLTEINLSKEDQIFRKMEVRFIKKIINFLDMPLLEKQLLEKQIESRLT